MKNLLVIAAVLLVLGGGVYALMRPSASREVQPASAPTANQVTGDETALSASRYVPFSPGALDGATQMRRVLFFYANWCSTCRPADTIFSQQAAQIPEDTVLFRVNYNDSDTDQAEKDLAQKYGVTYQHTFVQIDAQGNRVALWNGGQMAELLQNLAR